VVARLEIESVRPVPCLERRDDAAAARLAGELDCCSVVAPGEMPVDLVPN
jgi:hypothetical protein